MKIVQERQAHQRRSHSRPEPSVMAPSRSAALLLAAGLFASGCTSGVGGPGSRDDGPVSFVGNSESVSTAGMHADADESVVFGATEVRNDGPDPVTLQAGELTGEWVQDDGAQVAEVRVLDTTEGADMVGAGYWPYENYRRRSVPLDGFTLQPDRQVELLFIVSVEETGIWYWPQTMVRYVSDDRDYHAVIDFGFQICPRDIDECEKPTDPAGS